jgi:iron(III) transport system substrate-binding protein
MSEDDGPRRRFGRREILAASAATTATATAGCVGSIFGGSGSENELSLSDFRGSGPFVSGRPAPEGTSMDDLDNLSGELAIYIGGGEGGLYRGLIELLEKRYPDFEASVNSAPSTQLANTIVEEKNSGQSRADLFWSIDASSLGVVAEAGHTTSLPSEVRDPVPSELQDSNGRWVGVAGRARAIPYNTNEYSESDLPNKVDALANQARFQGEVGWGPTYGAFKSFVTAMRLLRGEQATREWLQGMLDQNTQEYRDEYFTSLAIADNEVSIGFANHYYILRIQAAQENPPIGMTFTNNDAGGLINVSGAEIIEGTQRQELAQLFIRHLLTAEAQEYFATRAYAYPMISGVQPVGDLPTIDELSPPDVDLTQLSNLEETTELMRDVGVL